MAKNKGKGTILAAEISSVYTAWPQILSIKKGGEKSTTYPGKTLDGSKHQDNPNDGYVDGPEFDVDYFYDSGNTVHAFLYTSMRTPPSAGVNFKLTDTASTPRVEIWNVTGIGLDEAYDPSNGVKGTAKLTTSGDPS